MRAHDDMAAMFCKRVATHTRKARDELEDIRRRQQSITERLVLALKAVLGQVDPDSPAAAMGTTASALAANTMKSLGARKTKPGAQVNFTFSSLSEASGPAVVISLPDARARRTQRLGRRGLSAPEINLILEGARLSHGAYKAVGTTPPARTHPGRHGAHQEAALKPMAGDNGQDEMVKVLTRAHKTLIWERT